MLAVLAVEFAVMIDVPLGRMATPLAPAPTAYRAVMDGRSAA